MDIKQFRSDYSRAELREEDLEKDPLILFNRWFKAAVQANISEVNAMTLATTSADGRPSARTVLLKEFNDQGFTFFTNYQSRKATELEQHPYAALLIFWKELERQIRIEGSVEKIESYKSDEYFHARPLESKMSAVISEQSQPISSRAKLEENWVEFFKNNFNKEINRPDYWGGYRVIPEKIEFWQGRPNRMHDRILYLKTEKIWKIQRLQP
jgi:pyridoxamine 5'-phosphate oxidase